MGQDPDEVARLIKQLKDTNWGRRAHAAQALSRIADPRAVVPLCEALNDWDWMGLSPAVAALVTIGAPSVLPLCELLKVGRAWARERAAEALGKIGDTRAVPPLCAALKDRDWYVRCSAAIALGGIGDSEAFVPLLEALQHESPELNSYAAEALGRIGGPRAVLPLYEAAKGKPTTPRVRIGRLIGQIILHKPAAEAMVQLGAAAVRPLCEVLKEGSSEARCQAAMMLARIAEREPVPLLREAVPLLHNLLPSWREEQSRIIRAALERIQAATASLVLPLPAAAPPPLREELPIPAAPPAPALEQLPIAAATDRGDADGLPLQRTQRSSD